MVSGLEILSLMNLFCNLFLLFAYWFSNRDKQSVIILWLGYNVLYWVFRRVVLEYGV